MKIALTGKMRSGKDTVAQYFIDNNNSIKLAFGDGIKEVAKQHFPMIVAKGKPRKLYQDIGQQFRAIDPLVWINQLKLRVQHFEKYGCESFVITDVRQNNEYEFLKNNGFTVIKVEAADEIRKERIAAAGDVYNEADFNHETELAVDGIPYDYLITNNGSHEELMQQLDFIREDMKKG